MNERAIISSKRTNLFKIILLGFSFLLFYWAYFIIRLNGSGIGFKTIGISIIVTGLGILIIKVSLNIKNLYVQDDVVVFFDAFNKKSTQVPLNQIKTYLIKDFGLGVFDPFSLNKFSVVKHENNQGKYDTYLILAPSAFSSNSDIAKRLKILQQAPKNIPNS